MNKSLFKRPGAKHFQLVHRSLRDPLIHDADASPHVLKEVGDSQLRKNPQPAASGSAQAFDSNTDELGDAAAYGIYFDDAEYDYMQHLRSVGSANDTYLVAAPEAPGTKKGKARARDAEFEIKDTPEPSRRGVDLPEDSLPSHPLDEISYTDLTSAQAPTLGLQPDLDPSIRQVLEALDDEAYAADDGLGSDEEDAFWKGVIDGGEVYEGDEREWSEDEEDEAEANASQPKQGGAATGWEAVAQFKKAAAGPGDSDDEDDEEVDSEGGDTIAELRAASARRPPRKPMGKSQAGSQFSMTSSAMFRNEGLRTLDDRFDQIEKMYEDDDSDLAWSGSDGEAGEDSDGNPRDPNLQRHEAPRQDLEQILDDFLSRYEVLGGKMRPVLEGTPGVEGNAGKLDRIRRELGKLDINDVVEEGEDAEMAARRREKNKILEAVERQEREEGSRKDKIRMYTERPKEKWDCETVLSTYSNVSNHPRLLRIRDNNGSRPAQIGIDHKTGFPVIEGVSDRKTLKALAKAQELADQEAAEEEEDFTRTSYPPSLSRLTLTPGHTPARPETITRPRGESAEERKARKDAIKAERAGRRVEKKNTKDAFGNETKRQKRIAGKAVAGGGAADVRVGEGVRRLA
ncbi:protein LTV1, partial [Phenoliferia sp. Uapishka_3]